MNRIFIAASMLTLTLAACNNESKDPVAKADSTNEAKLDSSSTTAPTIQTDAETTEFLVKAANGGMAEVAAGTIAQTKASNADVKEFASMMVTDHTAANAQVMALAAARNVTLPATVSDDKSKAAADLNAEAGTKFDKDYMDMQVKDHKETITLFEKAMDDSKDAEVKTFINNTLPKLKAHLEHAEMVQKKVK